MLCEKCKNPLTLMGGRFLDMFIDWWECPVCDISQENKHSTGKHDPKKHERKRKT